ncbi:hypothetical protein DYST_01896 [Dyella terrae]|nr:hypothetical protein DYST_01896 [Dyella terrae]
MSKITAWIGGCIFVINGICRTYIEFEVKRLGTLVPDAIHVHRVHFRGVGDYYLSPLVGIYCDWWMLIWLVGLILFFTAASPSNVASRDRNT